jgi:putative pyruvate formate lyase activating enzyme
MKVCCLCPQSCGARRLDGEKGFCGLADTLIVSHSLVHFGEEPPLVGTGGSGTIFLSGCNGKCLYCQNFQISHHLSGNKTSPRDLAASFLALQNSGCQNINWVTPEPQLPFLLESLAAAMDDGLHIPLIYNSNGYASQDVLAILDGIVDVYLPDMKYASDVWAMEFSDMKNYVDINRLAVKEMARQTGPFRCEPETGTARGVIVRHLILPEKLSGYRTVFQTLASIDPNIPVSIMAQYRPCYRAVGNPLIGRRITESEYRDVRDAFDESGLTTAFVQDFCDLVEEDEFFPDFRLPADDVFKGNQKPDNR